MTAKPLFFVVLLCQIIVFLTACSGPDTPQVVTQKFWTAVESGKAKEVKKFVSAKDKTSIGTLEEILPISNVSYGKIVIDGTRASVETTITLESDQSMDLPITTHLVKEGNRWAVDYERTIYTITAAGKVAAVINQFKDFGIALKDGIGRSVTELEKTLPSIEKELEKMEDQIQQAVPELRSRFENFSKQLEQALSAPIDSKPNSSDSDEGPAINQAPENHSQNLPDENDGEKPPKLTEQLSDIEHEILKAVPQLKSQIEDFVKELRKALEAAPEADLEEQKGNSTSIEI